MTQDDLESQILAALEAGSVLTVPADHRTWPALSDASSDALGGPARVVHVEMHDRDELADSLPTEGSGVLLLSGIGRAMPPVREDALAVLRDRRLGGWSLPQGWVIAVAK